MKKFILAAVSIFALGVLLSACSSHANCPAYGKAKVENVDKKV